MSDLTSLERINLEKLFDMSSGYAMNFSNRTFADFVTESTGIDIYTTKYSSFGDSKANRLRCFWANESNGIVGKLIGDLLSYYDQECSSPEKADRYEQCKQIAIRLKQSSPIDHVDRLSEHITSDTIDKLINSLRDAVQRNEPEAAIDRLHTLFLAFARERCEHHGLSFQKSEPLHSVFGKYVNHIANKGIVESKMAKTILRETSKLLDTFNDVRNNFSPAHANELLSQNEAYLILGWVRTTLDFVLAVDPERSAQDTPSSTDDHDYDIPF